MKKLTILLVILLSFTHLASIAQCGKKLKLTASKTEYLDTAGNVTRSVDEKSVIEIRENEILISPGSNPPMAGKLAAESCSWSKAFKEGRSMYNAVFEEPDKQIRTITITIEGKNGKLVFWAKVKEHPNRIIRLYPDQFEELK